MKIQYLTLTGLLTLLGALATSQTPLTIPDTPYVPLHPELEAQSRALLAKYPLMDTHIDLPATMRTIHRRPMDAIPKLNSSHPGHFDLPRAKAGGLAGAFFTANAPCPGAYGRDVGPDFLEPTETVQHVLESIDLVKNTLAYYPAHMKAARTASDVRDAFAEGKLAVLMGLEGTHGLANSLSTLRMYAELGVRYVTLTHVCHSSFASSNGGGAGTSGSTIPPAHPGNGLTAWGVELVHELNRLGVMVDLSHTSDNTARDAIKASKAPIVWTHSGARAINNHPRNVPDEILNMIGDGPDQNHGIVLSVLFSTFIDPNNATTARVVDHIEHIAKIVGKSHVGLGSDFNGISSAVAGMEDVSKWPNMIQELLFRGWTESEIAGIMGGNLLRVMEEVENVKDDLAHLPPSPEIYHKRTDLPAHEWGGPNMAYLAPDVQKIVVQQKRLRDEL
ncbi:uncharacterized protein I303_100732 [Kwoniella dejecticola CBS 10117]|uniref:Dipeptidase n=1 Tax=Kwoniella dejecticola CBS 10117 TaxID=1296121 RepID=A0A1A6AFR3_9TREE|nr:uncharacterized protein I303_00735 [Kwoniella dejecticola CBS 10117]OBR88917.1 hypothetical protein I303_00735 [Kwoniella dejecticola CBS 10117]